jgi:CRP-like cAMP-binding protein
LYKPSSSQGPRALRSKRKPSNVLSALPEKLLSELFEDTVAHKLRDGDVLFRAGDVGDGCYRIQTGLVKVVVTSQKGEERIISLLGPDAIVGELSMIDGGSRSAAVVAIAALAATTFLTVKQRLARALLGVAEYVGEKMARAGSNCSSRSVKATLQRWPAWRERTSAGP